MPPLMFDSREHHSKFRIMAYMYVYIYIFYTCTNSVTERCSCSVEYDNALDYRKEAAKFPVQKTHTL